MLSTLILLWLGFCLLFFLFRTRRPINFPPGPQPIPVFGNLLQLSLSNPIKDLEKLSERYGKVFSLYFGERPAVIVNGLQAMKEAMVSRSVDFAGRPQGLLISHITESKGVIMADYGPIWKEHRRFALMTLRNFGLGKKSMEERILEEISHVIACLEKSDGQSMCPQTLFHKAASNIICSIVFGTRYDHDDEFLNYLLRIFSDNARAINGPWAMLYDAVPLLQKFPLPFKKIFDNVEKIKKIAADLVAQHKHTRVPGDPRDLVDCYMDEIEKEWTLVQHHLYMWCLFLAPGKTIVTFGKRVIRVDRGAGDSGSYLNEDQLVMYTLDLYFAGTDTTSNTVLTALLYLTTHPGIQERCWQEIDAVLGKKAKVSFDDRHRMPYVQAFIHEVQRVSNTVPLSVFHCTTRDTQLMGYNIPKSTLIIQNLFSVLNEKDQWKFPHEFNPSNFLNEQGEFVKPEAFMPFSAGPRMCLGESLARMELFLIVVTLMRHFHFVWPEDAGVPDYTPMWGVTQTPKPYRLGVRIRGYKAG